MSKSVLLNLLIDCQTVIQGDSRRISNILFHGARPTASTSRPGHYSCDERVYPGVQAMETFGGAHVADWRVCKPVCGQGMAGDCAIDNAAVGQNGRAAGKA
jgi:hypothetical protein